MACLWNFDGKFAHHNRQFFWFYPSSYYPIIQNKIQMKSAMVERKIGMTLVLRNEIVFISADMQIYVSDLWDGAVFQLFR